MLISKSDNAIMAKVHCLFGKRLGAEDYSQLVQKRSIADIVSYLKNETYYSEVLSEVKEDIVHREEVEIFVGRRELEIYLMLSKYSSGDDLFFKMYKMKNEVQQLVFAMRLLNAGEMSRFIVSLPTYLAKHISFDLFEVAKAKDYDDLLLALEHSDYYNILGKFRPISHEKPINIPMCEAALLTHYYSKMLETVRHEFRGSTRQDLEKLFYYLVDFHNISVIYRMKRSFNSNKQTILSYLVNIHAKVSDAVYSQLIDANDVHEMDDVLKQNKLHDLFVADSNLSPEHMFFQTQRIRRRICQKAFRFSSSPVIVVICYMMMLEIEVNNIVNIIEGSRYEISPDEIRAMLVV